MEGQETTASTKSVMTLNSVEDVYNSQVDIPIYEKLGCASNAEKMKRSIYYQWYITV